MDDAAPSGHESGAVSASSAPRKNRGDEPSYDACDVHAWASVHPDFEPVEWPARLALEIIVGDDGVVFCEYDPATWNKIGEGCLP